MELRGGREGFLEAVITELSPGSWVHKKDLG